MASQPASQPAIQVIPIQGIPMQGIPIQGIPIQGFPIQGIPIQGFPIQGIPIQGLPASALGVTNSGNALNSTKKHKFYQNMVDSSLFREVAVEINFLVVWWSHCGPMLKTSIFL